MPARVAALPPLRGLTSNTMPSAPYAKMNGIGNSILVVDLRQGDAVLDGKAAQRVGRDPRFGFDQLMALRAPRSAGAAAYVEIFNTDGSPAGACGNGARCVAWMLGETSTDPEQVFDTAGGQLRSIRVGATTFAVDMGPPRLGWRDIPLSHEVGDTRHVPLAAPPTRDFAVCSAASMGNPHAVFFVPDAAAVPLAEIGPRVEHDPLFPDRANVSFAQIRSRSTIILRVWERGAGATLACGSAACATVVAAVRAGLTERTVQVHLPGGSLAIAWRDADGHVTMTGDVELEHRGMLTLDTAGSTA